MIDVSRRRVRAGRSGDDVVEKAMHDVGVHIAQLLVLEDLGQRADDGKAELFP